MVKGRRATPKKAAKTAGRTAGKKTTKSGKRPTDRKTTGMRRRAAALAPTTAEIALKAYYLGERRRALGLPGNPESDWLQAERELLG